MSWRALALASSATHLAAAAVVTHVACAALTPSSSRIRRAAQGRDGSQAITSIVRLFPRTPGPAHAALRDVCAPGAALLAYKRCLSGPHVAGFWLSSCVHR